MYNEFIYTKYYLHATSFFFDSILSFISSYSVKKAALHSKLKSSSSRILLDDDLLEFEKDIFTRSENKIDEDKQIGTGKNNIHLPISYVIQV